MTITKVFLAHQRVQKQRALSKVDESERSLKTARGFPSTCANHGVITKTAAFVCPWRSSPRTLVSA